MFKKLSWVAGLSFALICPTSLAATYLLTPGLSANFDFPAHAPQTLKNYLFWTISATCILKTQDDGDEFYARMINYSGKINEVKLSKGENMTVLIHNGDNLRISADAGAEVELTNQGQHTVRATCST